MKVPSPFWVLHNMGDQSDDNSLSNLGQELMISQFTRNIKVKLKLLITKWQVNYKLTIRESNQEGEKQGGPGNTEYDHNHKFSIPQII